MVLSLFFVTAISELRDPQQNFTFVVAIGAKWQDRQPDRREIVG